MLARLLLALALAALVRAAPAGQPGCSIGWLPALGTVSPGSRQVSVTSNLTSALGPNDPVLLAGSLYLAQEVSPTHLQLDRAYKGEGLVATTLFKLLNASLASCPIGLPPSPPSPPASKARAPGGHRSGGYVSLSTTSSAPAPAAEAEAEIVMTADDRRRPALGGGGARVVGLEPARPTAIEVIRRVPPVLLQGPALGAVEATPEQRFALGLLDGAVRLAEQAVTLLAAAMLFVAFVLFLFRREASSLLGRGGRPGASAAARFRMVACFCAPRNGPLPLMPAEAVAVMKVCRRELSDPDDVLLNASTLQLVERLRRARAETLHLCLHGHAATVTADGRAVHGVALTLASGAADVVDPAAFVEALAPLTVGRGGSLRLVLLNGCRTDRLLRALVDAGLEAGVAWSTAVHDEAALVFAQAFYGALLDPGTAASDAFAAAKSAFLARGFVAADPEAFRLRVAAGGLRYSDGSPVRRYNDGSVVQHSRVVHGVPVFVS